MKARRRLYTVGEIGRKYGVPLFNVYTWTSKLRRLAGVWSGRHGIVPIQGDIGGRYGIPEEFVDEYPKVPSQRRVRKIVKEANKKYQPLAPMGLRDKYR